MALNLAGFSLKRPVTVAMLFVSVVVLGAYCARLLPLALLPEDMDYPFLRVWIPYGNSTPLETEEAITIPAEEMLRTVRNIHEMSASSSENGSFVSLTFEQDTDMDVAYLEVRDRLERLKVDLPDEVDRTYIYRFQNTDIPIYYVGVEYAGELEDAFHPMENIVKKRLQRIDGVANVDLRGMIQKIVAINLDINKMFTHGISGYQVIQNLQQENFNVSGGTIEDGEQEYYVRSIGQYRTLEEVQNLPVKGRNIRLKDIAEVEYEFPIQEYLYRINGEYAMGIQIFKESSANTVAVANEVAEVLKELEGHPQLRGFQFHTFFNQSTDITGSLNDLQSSGLYGALFAIIVLFLFLRNFQTTLIVALSIPCSVMATLVFMYFQGMSLNIISMMGIMIAIGMLVDNAVVVVENIIRHRQMGKDRNLSAISGAREVSLAVIAGTMTTIIVFLPLIYTEGTMGRYLMEIGLPISVALVCSLVIAMTVIPLASSAFLGKTKPKTSVIVGWMNGVYGWLLERIVRNRIATCLALGGVFAVSFAVPARQLNYAGQPDTDRREIDISLRMPSYFKMGDTFRVCKQLEDFFDERREEFDIYNVSCFFRSSRGWVNLYLKKGDDATRSTSEIREAIREQMPKFPGVTTRLGWSEQDRNSQGSVSVRLFGDDSQVLLGYADEVKRRMAALDGVTEVAVDVEDATDEIHLTVDRLLAQKYGLSPFTVASTVSFGLRGRTLRSFKTPDGELDMWVKFRDDQTRNLEDLKALPLTTATGVSIPMGAVASFERAKGLGTLRRENGKTAITVKGTTERASRRALGAALRESMEGLELPQGYSWSLGRSFGQLEEDMQESMKTMIFSTVLVFLLMGALFESLIQPMVIIFSVPFAFPGMFWLLYVTGTTFDSLAWIGAILLIGIVVNNSIVLIDHINQLRAKGMARDRAIVSAGRDRLRPILMTAATTILGLIPMAMGMSEARYINFVSLSRAVIGGLMSGTLGTLIAIPLIYLFADELQEALLRLLSSLRSVFVRDLSSSQPG